MNLDDRIRSAQRQQLDAVKSQVEASGLQPPPGQEPRSVSGRLVFLAAAAVAVGVVGVLVVPQLRNNLQERFETVTSVDAATPSPEPEVDGSTPSTSVTSATEVAPTMTVTASPADAASSESTESKAEPSTTAAPASTTTSPASSPSTTSAPTTTTTSSTTVVDTSDLAVPVANLVCPSGFRAPLERAGTTYLSEEIGWSRKADLIDEQEGPYYYSEWEPNFPDPVSVEIVLPEPVLATDVRVAQNPFVEVGGTLQLEAAGLSFGLELEGKAGWIVHRFDRPTRLDRLTITRNDKASNVVELLICAEKP